MSKSLKLCLVYLTLITWNKAGHAHGYGMIVLYIIGGMITCNQLLYLKNLKPKSLLLCLPILSFFVISIIAWLNPQYRTLTMKDLIDLKFEEVLVSSVDSKKIEFVSNGINLVIGQNKKDPRTSLALFYYFKNRYQDIFKKTQKDVILQFFDDCEKRIILKYNKFLPSSTINGPNFFKDIYFLSLNIFIGIALFYSIKSIKEINILCNFLLINCLLLSFVGFYQISQHQWTDNYIEILGIWDAPEPRYYFSTFTYKNHWSAYALLMISCGFFLVRNQFHKLINTRKPFYQSKILMLLIVTIIVISFSILFSGSRSGLLVLSITILYYIFFWLRNRDYSLKLILNSRIIKASIFIPVIVFLTFIFINDKKMEEMVQTSTTQWLNWKDGKAPLRILFWKDSLEMFQEKPFIGYGHKSFSSIYPKFQSREVRSERAKGLENAHTPYVPLVAHAHNDFLEILLEWGLVGFFLIFLPFLIILSKFFTNARSNNIQILGLGCITFLLYCLLDFPTRTPACLASFSALLGLHFKYNSIKDKSR